MRTTLLGWAIVLSGLACGGSSGSAGGDGGSTTAPGGRYFPNGSVIYQSVADAPVRGDSPATIEYLDGMGGFGLGKIHIDFSMEVLLADDSAPLRAFEPTENHFAGACDIDEVPIPSGGAIEGESGYACDNGGDCHLIVVHEPTSTLYEMWKADIAGDTFEGGCLAIWDMERVYGPEGRGYDCTSADAAGLPIAPLLFSADEVQSGSIDHAIRFILPNDRIRNGVYVAPATHTTSATGGGSAAPPYGARLRLRADYDLSSLSAGARVVAQAMKDYGMILADGGNVALTAQSDRFTTAKWDGLLEPQDLDQIPITAFEVVDTGEPRTYSGDCQR